jgi:hypothetical protein
VIHVISTSACLPNDYEFRKSQYLEGLESIKKHFKIDPYIIETIRSCDYLGKQFIGNNNYSSNKGANEFANIQEFFKQHNHLFDDNDDIIKTTLRYAINSSHFIELVKSGTQDIYCRCSSEIYGAGDTGVHTFLISMKYKCWKEFFNNYFDVTCPDPIEWKISEYVRNKGVTFVDRLGIDARPWNHRPRVYSV